MKYLLLADIHGNVFALENCLKNLSQDEFDEIIFLGDYVSDIPRSHEVLEFIRKCQSEYKCHVIIGNREERVLSYIKGEHPDWTLDTRFADAVYTASQLTEEDVTWLESLPQEIVLEVENKKLHISHDYDNEIEDGFDFKLFGHEHNQFNYKKDNLQVINPGSVGITVDEKPVMQYTILDINNDGYEIKDFNIYYDMSEVIDSVRNAPTYNAPYRWGKLLELILLTGIDFIDKCMKEYDKLRASDGVEEDSLEYWNRALNNCNVFCEE